MVGNKYLDTFNSSSSEVEAVETSKSRDRQAIGIPGQFDDHPMLAMTAHRGSVPSNFKGCVMIDTTIEDQYVIDLAATEPAAMLHTLRDFMLRIDEPSDETQIDYIVNLFYLPAVDERGKSLDVRNWSGITYGIDRNNYDHLLPRFLEDMQERGFLPRGARGVLGLEQDALSADQPHPSLPSPEDF